MNNVVFRTGGDWDSTTLHNNNEEVLASRLYVELHAGRDDFGNPTMGGIQNSGEATAYVLPQANPDQEIAIFPGRLELVFPAHALVIENTHPTFAIEFTRVWLDGRDITQNIVDVNIDVDAVNDNVVASLILYKPHWIVSDEVATYNLLG